MDIVRKPYKIYMDEDGYRFSCRVQGCEQPTSSHWLRREDAVTAGNDHFTQLHAERDRDLEKWVEALAVSPEELELQRREVLGAGEVISDSVGENG